MSNASFSYFIFCFFVLVGCTFLQTNSEKKKSLLLLASYYFYMTLDWRFSFLLMGLTLVNYSAGQIIASSDKSYIRKLALAVAIIVSIAILFYFKYAGFFVESLHDILRFFGASGESPVVDVILPIGISFMTFQAITYPLDLYARKLEYPSSLKDFALFMSFFPQLLSGPIIRASFFLPQLRHDGQLSGKNMMDGLALVIRGLIKKIMIADILAVQIVDPAFANPTVFSSAFLVIALFAYSFQVYMDLGGYTDIAIGIGKMMGYRLPINFNRPYLATSIANYWQRWHITMSSFFRDYLYEPIRGWKWSNIYFNLLIVFVAIGIWHGAGWNFILYGFIHGGLVGLEHYRTKRRQQRKLPPIVFRGAKLVLRVMQIFTIVTLSRLLFRGDDLAASWAYLQAIANSSTQEMPLSPVAILVLSTAAILHFTPVNWRDRFMAFTAGLPGYVYAPATVLLIYALVALGSGGPEFIYFQF